MSIWASLTAPSDDHHEEGCAFYVETSPNCYEISGKPCSCGQPASPLVYRGSHILPELADPRGGYIDLAYIPAHVRFWRENPDANSADEPWDPIEPFLRFGVNGETVILTTAHVEEVYESLGHWLRRAKGEEQG